MINEHDRIIMLAMVPPYGLMVPAGQRRFCIDPSFADILRYKKMCLCVGVMPDKFVERYDLNCFYTGNDCFELREARYMGISFHYTLPGCWMILMNYFVVRRQIN